MKPMLIFVIETVRPQEVGQFILSLRGFPLMVFI
jgi:hypothetical protein